jgi:hypothetical protein
MEVECSNTQHLKYWLLGTASRYEILISIHTAMDMKKNRKKETVLVMDYPHSYQWCDAIEIFKETHFQIKAFICTKLKNQILFENL